MSELKLKQGATVLIDEIDYQKLANHKWSLSSSGYAVRHIRVNGKTKTFHMHRELLQPKSGFDVDHINGNKLDNRRLNLRTVTRTQNSVNKGANKNNKSGYKGVCWDKQMKKWRSGIGYLGKTMFIGLYKDKKEAAIAYDESALELFGKFAKLNFC